MWSIPTIPVVLLSSCPEKRVHVVQAGSVVEAGREPILQPQPPNAVFTIVRHHALEDCTLTPHEARACRRSSARVPSRPWGSDLTGPIAPILGPPAVTSPDP